MKPDEIQSEPLRADADQAMDRYADGDEEAFALVYDALAPRLAAFVRRQVRDPEIVRDVVQDTFLHMHRARATFLRGAPVLPWAFAIARRLVIDGARRHRTRPTSEPLAPDLVADPVVVDDEIHAHQTAQRLAAALAQMPTSHRSAFELLKRDGLSLEQAAGVLGTTVTAVKLRVHRAIAALRSVLERDTEG